MPSRLALGSLLLLLAVAYAANLYPDPRLPSLSTIPADHSPPRGVVQRSHERSSGPRLLSDKLNLSLWVILGFACALCMKTNRSLPAPIGLLFAIAGGSVTLAEWIEQFVHSLLRLVGLRPPQVKVRCHRCMTIFDVITSSGAEVATCPQCGARNGVPVRIHRKSAF